MKRKNALAVCETLNTFPGASTTFVFWYRGLVLGGIAGVGQLQLLQPFFGLILAAVFLREPIAWTMIASTAIVVLSVAGAKRFA